MMDGQCGIIVAIELIHQTMCRGSPLIEQHGRQLVTKEQLGVVAYCLDVHGLKHCRAQEFRIGCSLLHGTARLISQAS